MEYRIKILKNEYWFGGAVDDGCKMPLDAESDYYLDCRVNSTYNQFNGLFVSSLGRFVYIDGDAEITVKNGNFFFKGDFVYDYRDGYKTLKNAYLAAANKHFDAVGKSLDFSLFSPMYCTWSEMLNEPTEEKISEYARSIANIGYPRSCILIDDGWMKSNGDWNFAENKFKNPSELVSDLHNLGFKVVLWVTPFIDFYAESFDELKAAAALMRDRDGEVKRVEWWNGVSALLDLSTSYARKWFGDKLDALMKNYGVDGFKFDAGDAMYYVDCDTEITPNEHSRLYAEFAAEYDVSELRACCGLGGYPIMQRLSDKRSDWSEKGLGSLIPNVLQAGLCGYPYVCADMVGGGQLLDYKNVSGFDGEFYARSCEIATYFPLIQFSYAVWNRSGEIRSLIEKCLSDRNALKEYYGRLFKNAGKTFEPVVRSLEYEFPNLGYAKVMDEFMIGDEYLVAPIFEKGKFGRQVIFPAGADWLCEASGKTYRGGEIQNVEADVNSLPIFKRV